MEQNENTRLLAPPPEAATDEPAFVPTLVSAALNEEFGATVPDGPRERRPRHDGWTHELKRKFLERLAECGVAVDAAKMVGKSAAGAYALRNRDRAFDFGWKTVLAHRARHRLSDEVLSRSMNGCIEQIEDKNGNFIQRHRYDNRLSMAVLTRLDREAEKLGADAETSRAVAEELEGFLDCIEQGEGAEAFIEARRPKPPTPERAGPDGEERNEADLDRLAMLNGGPDYRDVDPTTIDVSDLDPSETETWTLDQWLRGFRSGFLPWLEIERMEDDRRQGPGTPLRFHALREGAVAAVAAGGGDAEGAPGSWLRMKMEGLGAEIETADLDPAAMADWTDDQWARGWCSGLIEGLPARFWDDLAESGAADEAGEQDQR